MLQEQEEMHQRDVRHARADSERHVRDSLDSMVARQRKQVLLQRAEEHRDAHEARVADEHARELQQQEVRSLATLCVVVSSPMHALTAVLCVNVRTLMTHLYADVS